MAKRKFLNMMSQFRTLSIKVYDEQLPNGWDSVCRIIRSLMNKAELQVIAICHNRDYVTDEYWLPSVEKPHYHIIVRILNNKRMRVNQILNTLGIVFRNEIDKVLWENHGVESCDNYTNMAVYLTHDTAKAINDGKEQYELEELVSNLTIEEIRQIREGYTRVSDAVEKVTPAMLAQLDDDAYKLGCELGDYDAWHGSLPFNVRSSAKMKTVKESYNRGVDEQLKKIGRVYRLCVFIQSPKNMGKTEAAHRALERLGVEYLDVCAGGTGKYDELTPSTGAIVVDDAPITHILAMADTRCCKVYRRGSSNRPWMGDYLIVTSNKTFDRWLDDCGVDYDNRDAARSRFYVCCLGQVEGSGRNVLVCMSRAERGSDDFLQKMDQKYIQFRDLYNDSLAEYHRSRTARERVDINGYIATPSEIAAYNAARESA